MTSDSPLPIASSEPFLAQLLDDYPEALVRIASLRAEKKQYLLFAWIELYPIDIQTPSGWQAGDKPWNVPGSSGWTLAFSARQVKTDAVLDWYSQIAGDSINIAVVGPKAVMAEIPRLAPEPVLGNFAIGADIPFAFRWHDDPRIHRMVPMHEPNPLVVELGKNAAARGWLEEHLGFDPFSNDEWLGGLALLAPDPVCASIRVFPSARPPAEGETLSIHAVPRRTAAKSADLTSLTIHIAERRVGAWTNIASMAVPSDGFASYRSMQPTDHVAWAIVCRKRGLLRVSPPAPWFNQAIIDMEMAQGRACVEVPSGGRRKPAQNYEVPQHTTVETLNVGEPADDEARARLRQLIALREERERLETVPQRLFGIPTSEPTGFQLEEKKKEAQDFIVSLTKRAQQRLIFVDSYFGLREMRLFSLQNTDPRVTPCILTGLDSLRKLEGENPGFQFEQGLLFAADIQRLETSLGNRTPIVRVMPERQGRPIIHDRYLVVDNEVWHCGPSFNELGERLGLIVKLPHPKSIQAMIDDVWSRSKSLTEMAPVLPSRQGAL